MKFNYKRFTPSVLALASLLGTAPSSFAEEGGTAGAAAFKLDPSTGNVSQVAAAAAIGKKSAFAGSFVSGITGELEAFALGTGNSFRYYSLLSPGIDGERLSLAVNSNQEGGGTAGAVSFGLDPSTGNVIQVAAAAAIGKKSAFAKSTSIGYLQRYGLDINKYEAIAVGTENQLTYRDDDSPFLYPRRLTTVITSSDGEGDSTAGAAAFKLDPTTGNVSQVAAAAAIGKTALALGRAISGSDTTGGLEAFALGTRGNSHYAFDLPFLYSTTTLDGEGNSTAGAAAFKLDPTTGNVSQVAAAAAIGKTAFAGSTVSGITGGLEAYALGTGSSLSYVSNSLWVDSPFCQSSCVPDPVGSDGEGGGTAGAAAFKLDPTTGNVSQVAAAAAIGEKSAFAGSAVSGITGGLKAYALGTESSLFFQSQILSATDPDDSFSEVGETKPKSEKIRLSTEPMSNLATLQANTVDEDSGTAGAVAFKLDPTTGNVSQVAAAAAIGEKSAFAGSAVSGITGGLEAYALGTESSLLFQSQILSATYINDPFFGFGEIKPESEKIRLSTDPISNLATFQANTVDEDSGTAGAAAFRLDDSGNVSEGVVAAAIGKKSAFAGSTVSGITGRLNAYALGTGSSIEFRGSTRDFFFNFRYFPEYEGQSQGHGLSVSADGEGGGTAGAAAFKLDFSGNISQVAAAAAIGEKSALASVAISGLTGELEAFSLGTESRFTYGSSAYGATFYGRYYPPAESHGVSVYSDENSTNTINLLAVDPLP